LLAAAVALLALTGLPMSNNIGALTVGAVQHLDDHGASPSCGCFGSSHCGIDRSTSTPLRHLPYFYAVGRVHTVLPFPSPYSLSLSWNLTGEKSFNTTTLYNILETIQRLDYISF